MRSNIYRLFIIALLSVAIIGCGAKSKKKSEDYEPPGFGNEETGDGPESIDPADGTDALTDELNEDPGLNGLGEGGEEALDLTDSSNIDLPDDHQEDILEDGTRDTSPLTQNLFESGLDDLGSGSFENPEYVNSPPVTPSTLVIKKSFFDKHNIIRGHSYTGYMTRGNGTEEKLYVRFYNLGTAVVEMRMSGFEDSDLRQYTMHWDRIKPELILYEMKVYIEYDPSYWNWVDKTTIKAVTVPENHNWRVEEGSIKGTISIDKQFPGMTGLEFGEEQEVTIFIGAIKEIEAPKEEKSADENK